MRKLKKRRNNQSLSSSAAVAAVGVAIDVVVIVVVAAVVVVVNGECAFLISATPKSGAIQSRVWDNFWQWKKTVAKWYVRHSPWGKKGQA